MYVEIECQYCGGLNVAGMSYDFSMSEFVVETIQKFEDFYDQYRNFVASLPDFPIEKSKLLRMIKQALNVNTNLAYDILDRLKLDLGLYEKNGIIYSTDEYL